MSGGDWCACGGYRGAYKQLYGNQCRCMERAISHAHAVADDDELTEQWEQRAEMERAIEEMRDRLRRLDEAIAERVRRLKEEMK